MIIVRVHAVNDRQTIMQQNGAVLDGAAPATSNAETGNWSL